MSFVARMRKEHADLAEKLNKLHAFRGTAVKNRLVDLA